ncbi:MAG: tetratricopeptide repeat protein [Tepidisphaeraceae bacterium]
MLALSLVGGCASSGTGTTNTTATQDYVNGYRSYKAGDQDAAIRSLQSAVAKNPNLTMARSLLGDLYRQRNDYASAAQQYEALTRLDPYTQSNQYYLGLSYQFLARYVDAARAYLSGLKLSPKDFRSNENLGTVYLAVGDIDNAVTYLDRATQIEPKNANAWSNLGVALDARQSYVLAESAYRKAIELDTHSLPIMQNLANNLLLQEKVGEAIYLWEQIVQRSKTSFTQTKLAEAYTRGSEFKKANTVLDRVLLEDPRYVPAINAKADLMIREYELSGFVDDKSRQDGVRWMKLSLSLNGSQPRVREQLNKYQTALPLH